jgi:hypothetical protein
MKRETMKPATGLVLLLMLAGSTVRAEIKVTALKGRVYVRHNVQEQWVPVARGDVLKPEDSMKSDEKSSSTLLVDGKTTVVLPEMAIIDLSDLRSLTREDLLLKLAMERIRSVPGSGSGDELNMPRTTIIHGPNVGQRHVTADTDPEIGAMQMKGTEVLFGNGFYETGVLKAKGLFRIHPELAKRTDDRLMVAKALEKLTLKGEALEEYVDLRAGPLTDQQRAFVSQKIGELKGMR